jgi:UDP-glucuronate 4-epimerase
MQKREETILLTGASGFIGFHLAKKLKTDGYQVICVDSLESSYENKITNSRQDELSKLGIKIYQLNLSHESCLIKLNELMQKNDINKVDIVIHLAAWTGVLRSISEPEKYFENNVIAFFNILMFVKIHNVQKFVFASSSSVYGNVGVEGPCREIDLLPEALNFYAQTKKMNEDLARIYLNSNQTYLGLRFFTVIGPWGRPDMAYWKFTEAIKRGLPITLRGEVGGIRDYTSVYDVVDSIQLLLDKKVNTSAVINISSSTPIPTIELVKFISAELGKPAKIFIVAAQKVEARVTFGDNRLLTEITGKKDFMKLEEMARDFVSWHNEYEKMINVRD